MNPAPQGVIRADEAYTVPEFRQRARLGQYAWRKLRASGFPVIEIGRKLYVLGEDFIQYCREQRDETSRIHNTISHPKEATTKADRGRD